MSVLTRNGVTVRCNSVNKKVVGLQLVNIKPHTSRSNRNPVTELVSTTFVTRVC